MKSTFVTIIIPIGSRLVMVILDLKIVMSVHFQPFTRLASCDKLPLNMKVKILLVTLLLFFGGLVAVGTGRDTVAFDAGVPYSGRAQIDGSLKLEMAVSPPISTPGDILKLAVSLRNKAKVTVSPEVIFQVPSGLSLDSSRLPAGMTVNFQTNELNWLPIIPANGGIQEAEFALRVETADIIQPEKFMTAVLRSDGVEQSANASIWVGLPPFINQIIPLPQVAVGQPVQLLADIGGSGPVGQTWYLGDGRRLDINDPVVAYAAPGSYEIVLDVSNPLASERDFTISKRASITIVPQPAAQFLPNDLYPGVGQPINLINQSGGQPPLIYRWDFGDGTTSTEASPSHQYTTPGMYTVHLTVENGFGQSEAFWPVTVGGPPVADMEIEASAPAGQPVMGQAFGDDSVTVFRWDMGDGQVVEGESVAHPYRQTGDFYVSMTAYNEFGGTEIGRWVHIDPGQLATYLPLILRFDGQAGGLEGDLYGLVLDPVGLDGPFVMEPMDLPAGLNPAQQLFLYINEARRQFELPPLNLLTELSTAAQHHVNDMASFEYTAHIGSDGSYPAERLLWQGYRGAYAGEATAWGFEQPYRAVEYWINSDAHRRIILNRYANDVGVGFTTHFNSPNVWYWTAEFGNSYAATIQPIIRLDEDQTPTELMISDEVSFGWNWPLPLDSGQHFTVYLQLDGTMMPLGTVVEPELSTLYRFVSSASNDWSLVGSYQWQVVLETETGMPIHTSTTQAITFLPDPNLPTPTPEPTAVPLGTLTPTPIPPSPTPLLLEVTPRPTVLPPPVIITATPSP